MSNNEQLNRYKELYSQLVSEFAKLHNTHIQFITYVGRDTGFATRKHLSEIYTISNEMRKIGRHLQKESLINRRLAMAKAKEEKRISKLSKKKREQLKNQQGSAT